jgi:hypothetical protein
MCLGRFVQQLCNPSDSIARHAVENTRSGLEEHSPTALDPEVGATVGRILRAFAT